MPDRALWLCHRADNRLGQSVTIPRLAALQLISFGACRPLAVKIQAPGAGAENGDRVVASLRPAQDPRFPILTAVPPLIAAWLVGCMRNTQAKEKGNANRRL